MLIRALLGGLVAAVLVPAAAGAAQTPLRLGEGDLPNVAIDDAGVAYVAWRGTDAAKSLTFCRVPKAATACDGGARALTVPETGESRPFVFLSGSRVVIVESRGHNVYLLVSQDKGATFAPARSLGGPGMLLDAVAGPGESVSLVATDGANLRFANAGLAGTGPAAATILSPNGPFDFGAVDLDQGAPLVLLYDGSGNAAWRRYKGTGDVNDEGNWTSTSTPGYLGEQPGLAGGPLGLFATGRESASSTSPVVRKFAGGGFADPEVIEPGSANPVVGEDPAGRLHALYGTLDLKHAYSDDGTNWTVEVIAPDARASRPQVAAAADHTGVAVYSNPTITLARFGSASGGSGGGETSKTIKGGGGTLTLTGPPRCVPAHESFKAKVTATRKSKRSLFVKPLRVDFLVDGKRLARDTQAPFRQSLLQFDVPAGTEHTLSARVKVELREGGPVTRTISLRFAYCG